MRYPNFSEEKKLWKKGFKKVVGLDEAGRGPLSGPVVAAAVLIKSIRKIRAKFVDIRDVKDSKKLSPKKREELYKILINHPQIKWGIGKASEKVIDKINILEATKLAMKRAVKNLEKKIKKKKRLNLIEFLILDGRMKLDLDILQKSIIKADNKVFSCAAASIIAKVSRDRMMRRYGKKYPQYGFSKHKGYATKLHLKRLKKYGPCSIHRKSFRPVKKLLNY
ncbi:MAG: ribonuclease HII [Candidatus Nealsonbacteria bacterium]|nr:MAG: ribonuclease HII [Candidatus Nealsonbacteria bacterium]